MEADSICAKNHRYAMFACISCSIRRRRSTKVELRGDAFTYDEAKDEFVCPMGITLPLRNSYGGARSRISKILYESKKWWQFWKKKKQIGYQVKQWTEIFPFLMQYNSYFQIKNTFKTDLKKS